MDRLLIYVFLIVSRHDVKKGVGKVNSKDLTSFHRRDWIHHRTGI